MAELRYLVTGYTEGEVDGNTAIPPSPEIDEDPTTFGIEFLVTPQVSGDAITLTLHPTVREFGHPNIILLI